MSHAGGLGCSVARGLASPEEVIVSPDSRDVLVAGIRSNAVVVLRAGPDGLSQDAGTAGCIARGGGPRAAASGRRSPARRSRDQPGRSLRLRGASIADAVAILHRDPATGVLTQRLGRRGCISQSRGGGLCMRGRGLDEVWGVALSPDGRNLYAVSSKVNMLSAMARDKATGRLPSSRAGSAASSAPAASAAPTAAASPSRWRSW